jgi:hypothetical protein
MSSTDLFAARRGHNRACGNSAREKASRSDPPPTTKQNTFIAGPQRVCSAAVVSRHPGKSCQPEHPLRSARSTTLASRSTRRRSEASGDDQSLALRVAHNCPLGGFLMTHRRPRVDNPNGPRYLLRKNPERRNLRIIRGFEDFMKDLQEVIDVLFY